MSGGRRSTLGAGLGRPATGYKPKSPSLLPKMVVFKLLRGKGEGSLAITCCGGSTVLKLLIQVPGNLSRAASITHCTVATVAS